MCWFKIVGNVGFRVQLFRLTGCWLCAGTKRCVPQVLEIIDDKEVRSLREGQPPKLFTADAGEKGAATWWWWRQEREGLPPHSPLQI